MLRNIVDELSNVDSIPWIVCFISYTFGMTNVLEVTFVEFIAYASLEEDESSLQ